MFSFYGDTSPERARDRSRLGSLCHSPLCHHSAAVLGSHVSLSFFDSGNGLSDFIGKKMETDTETPTQISVSYKRATRKTSASGRKNVDVLPNSPSRQVPIGVRRQRAAQ